MVVLGCLCCLHFLFESNGQSNDPFRVHDVVIKMGMSYQHILRELGEPMERLENDTQLVYFDGCYKYLQFENGLDAGITGYFRNCGY